MNSWYSIKLNCNPSKSTSVCLLLSHFVPCFGEILFWLNVSRAHACHTSCWLCCYTQYYACFKAYNWARLLVCSFHVLFLLLLHSSLVVVLWFSLFHFSLFSRRKKLRRKCVLFICLQTILLPKCSSPLLLDFLLFPFHFLLCSISKPFFQGKVSKFLKTPLRFLRITKV